ncbi:DUF1853 family protein [Marinobacter sp. X15-166B]|uniref:DUF1853 family protein n=1 Tax=Marinobacter sp. X15-166B TaxID=1897620 RepID=UPI00085C1999|nr:DUF1853 family protein [Marinobacter sp. X15-166B]OEY66969.1 hypothetical protein BG841_11230 [Marinobacter sp. X15-166B]
MTNCTRPLWNSPAVRHLDWLCHAQPLIDCGPVFAAFSELPADIDTRLHRLDRNPAPLVEHLARSASHRLGHYFESLYHFLLSEILEWPVLLRNTPIRDTHGRTLGELDFIVRNGRTGELEHHEVAVKFYLGLSHGQTTRWYGPNAQDRLDIKTQRMLTHQCRMTERPETRAALDTAGLDGPIRSVLAKPGTLFSPHSPESGPARPPGWANPGHDRGGWVRLQQVTQLDTRHWTLLIKPEWLSRHQHTAAPDAASTRAALTHIARDGRPRLFAEMTPRSDRRGYEEINRWFVVPDHWPQPHPATPCDPHTDRSLPA